VHLTTDVLVIGAGGAGMYAALEAARQGADVLLIDRSLIGRGGATVMAQMTVAAAVGGECPDHWQHHLVDTLRAGRGLCDPALARVICEDGLECILEMDAWGVGWARKEGRFTQVMAPGHDRPRCVYVDFLNTGPAVSRTLRTQLIRAPGSIRRVGDLLVTRLQTDGGECVGASALHVSSGEIVTIGAAATVMATGGLTRLYRRNSASANMGGDGYALALRAGAALLDMEFVQFFPIGHLAPRMIGMDPIMWDPFRYKLGGRLLNGNREEFVQNYGAAVSDKYIVTRDLATYAITKEVEAGRGSPNGGAYLSFEHLSAEVLREAFGPVIDRIAKNGIDLTQMPIEVAPIAHYHMGGIQVDAQMRTTLARLFAAGEAVGGANGANRLSGNAITEALAFGRRAGRYAAQDALANGGLRWDSSNHDPHWYVQGPSRLDFNPAQMLVELQALMADEVGPFRTEAGLQRALDRLVAMRARVGEVPPLGRGGLDCVRIDWFDLFQMLLVAEVVTRAALLRTESRGAHQREDFPGLEEAWRVNQVVNADGCELNFVRREVPASVPIPEPTELV
jgi:succinate dehydrogenase/fumarate reductase flavoprotein subunit